MEIGWTMCDCSKNVSTSHTLLLIHRNPANQVSLFPFTNMKKSSLKESHLPKALTAFKWSIKHSLAGQSDSKPGLFLLC